MKNYRITVNGVAYDVAVEEMGEGAATSAPAPAAAPKPAAPKAAPAAAGAGAVKINSPMPGNIFIRESICRTGSEKKVMY